MKYVKLFIAAAALVSFMACNPIEDSKALNNRMVDPSAIFIDGTHIDGDRRTGE